MNIFCILYIIMIMLLIVNIINKKYECYIYNILFLLIFIINFIKDNFTPDSMVYNNEFSSNNFWHFEPFFILLSLIAKIFNLKFYFISSMYSLFTFYFLYESIKKLSLNINFSLFLFFLIPGFYLNTFIQMRQMFAISIVLFTICYYYYNGGKKINILLILFSIFAHYSAIIFWIMFLFIKGIKLKQITAILLIISTITLILVFFSRIDVFLFDLIKSIIKNIPILAKYSGYLSQILNNQIEMVNGQYFKNLFFILVGLFIGVTILVLKKENTFIKTMTNLYIIGTIFLNLTMYIAPLSRIFYYFGIFQIFLIPYAVSKFDNKNIRMILNLAIIVAYIIIFFNGLQYTDTAGNYVFNNYSSYIF